MVSRFFDSASYPKGLEKSARQWRRQIVEWRKNRKSLDQLRTPDQKLAQVKKWMAAGKSAGKSQPQAALVPNLLASHWLSQTLPQIPLTDAQRSQEALYLSGQVAESLSELNFWSVPEDYYESCVRVSSKGQYTEECRKGLARTILTRTSIQKLEDLPIDLRERIQGI
jgi:hypothetical protein